MKKLLVIAVTILFLMSSCGIYEEQCPGVTQKTVNN
jgi:hypothetical protein